MQQVLKNVDTNTKTKTHKTTLMQTEFPMPQKNIVSIAVMTILIVCVYFCNIPNPNMILIIGLVFCSAAFGYDGGITAGVIMLFYTLFFYSTEHSFIHFTEQSIQNVFVSLIGIFADLLLVCSLKCEEIKAFKNIKLFTEKLEHENKNLQVSSMQDSLTEIQNRLALRRDFDLYNNRKITVMMIDLDNFKAINDTYGHEAGDRALQETGAILAKTFGRNHCYRYGGDEFLVICPDLSEREFREKLDNMLKSKPNFNINGQTVNIDFSVGYVHGTVTDTESLRHFLSDADKRMYAAKKTKHQKAL